MVSASVRFEPVTFLTSWIHNAARYHFGTEPLNQKTSCLDQESACLYDAAFNSFVVQKWVLEALSPSPWSVQYAVPGFSVYGQMN